MKIYDCKKLARKNIFFYHARLSCNTLYTTRYVQDCVRVQGGICRVGVSLYDLITYKGNFLAFNWVTV